MKIFIKLLAMQFIAIMLPNTVVMGTSVVPENELETLGSDIDDMLSYTGSMIRPYIADKKNLSAKCIDDINSLKSQWTEQIQKAQGLLHDIEHKLGHACPKNTHPMYTSIKETIINNVADCEKFLDRQKKEFAAVQNKVGEFTKRLELISPAK